MSNIKNNPPPRDVVSGPQKGAEALQRQQQDHERLSAALRENLKRRKQGHKHTDS